VPEPASLRIGVRFALTGDPGELFADARAVEAAGADSIWADAADADPYVLLAAFAAVTWRVRLVASGARDDRGRATCERLARGRLALAEELAEGGERWTQVPFPKDRDEWRALRTSAAERGAGIVLPNDPRLMDLLRNPDVVDDRSDLNIATG
jgi:alkanesulfonate monooxygenase SsuD/methylene tetrahydromethanopterin reductase-like flavin-dependent oxidoreductase (luciferase family)